MVPNAATRRWCGADGKARALLRLQSPRRPLFTPLAPVAGVPDSLLDSAALYAGETASRIGELTSARQAVADLTPR